MLKSFLRVCYHAAAWRPATGRGLLRAVVARRANEAAGCTDDDHLAAAAAWIARAQDAAGDGGVTGRYHLRRGWTSSYPETTGYLVPTLLALADATGRGAWEERAERAVRFLLGVQLPDGGFPGGEVHENRSEPSVFNTGQILHGLTAWHRRTGDDRALTAAVRAGAWMAAAQEPDGSWRRWIYGREPYTYMAYAAGWLGQLGQLAGEPRLREAAARHLDWALGERDAETGWFRRCGFEVLDGAPGELAHTHTIAYTLAGVLELSRLAGRDDGVAAARDAAVRVARTLELRRWLPGVLDRAWKGRASYACLTGNAQMALIWLDLHRLRHDPALVSAALKAIDLVKLAQPMTSRNPALRGGVPGSDPPWGGYLYLSFPNWAVKYFVDALLAKRAALDGLAVPARQPATPALRTELPAAPAGAGERPLRVVLLAGSRGARAVQIAEACRRHGVPLAAVISEARPEPPFRQRLRETLREDGVGPVVRKGWARLSPRSAPAAANGAGPSLAGYCAAHGIPYVRCERLDSAEGRALLEELAPDLGVHAGAGILRQGTLAAHRLGVLNAHMGLLPWLRGMNVAEWSVLYGLAVGCTVHLIDPGIDTGDILAHRLVPVDGARGIRSVDALRQRVDEAQLALLGEVVAFAARTGTLPPRSAQGPEDGRQYFRLHPEVLAVLERHLAAGP